MSTDELRLEYVPLSVAVQWNWADNAKIHDIGGLCESIRRYGFRDPPEVDLSLAAQGTQGTQGAFAQGNGRVQALAALYREDPDARPRYIIALPDGRWGIPVLFGADSQSQALAMAYALDVNALVLTGGNTEIWDLLALYDREQLREITEALGRADQGLITMDGQSLDMAGKAENEQIEEPPDWTSWTFLVSFKGPGKLLAELDALMAPYFVAHSRRKLMPEFFLQMVRAYCGEERPVVLI